ncbi:VanZ family protein [Microbacterium sp. NPDC076911]|uniref:VanZ family protein n=1 Tax=Microbacterium sp. NPDC076911 TaxID=3154958 RepID=UPI00344849B4
MQEQSITIAAQAMDAAAPVTAAPAVDSAPQSTLDLAGGPPPPPPGYILVPPRPPLAVAPEWRPRAPQSSTLPARVRALVRERRDVIRDPRAWLVAYGVLLALIAFWPTPVDRNAAGLLRTISAAIPWLSYNLIEFTANIALFVPLGALGAMLLTRRPWLVVVVALAVTVVIESVQALLLAQRTPSGLDIIANTLGAAVGLAIVLLVRRRNDARS